tara:strand:- start:1011 stop:1214 length:204 start_codon:yes stop_codon:yes gene_type:complete
MYTSPVQPFVASNVAHVALTAQQAVASPLPQVAPAQFVVAVSAINAPVSLPPVQPFVASNVAQVALV